VTAADVAVAAVAVRGSGRLLGGGAEPQANPRVAHLHGGRGKNLPDLMILPRLRLVSCEGIQGLYMYKFEDLIPHLKNYISPSRNKRFFTRHAPLVSFILYTYNFLHFNVNFSFIIPFLSRFFLFLFFADYI
jgi:hypothetical protein